MLVIPHSSPRRHTVSKMSLTHVRDGLRKKRAGQLSAGDLVSVLDDTSSRAALICTHGDLANALPASTALKPEYDKDG